MALLSTAADFLARQLAGDALAVTYSRGVEACSIDGLPGQSEHPAADDNGLVTVYVSQDFIVAAADLVLSGGIVEPQAGDRIETAAGDVFEVLPADGRDCFRYSDPPRNTRMRIFTKRVTSA